MAEQLSNVSLPDENLAWADMRRRLEKDDDDRIIPFWLNSCLLWSLFGVVILSLGWWIIRAEKRFERNRVEQIKTTSASKEEQKSTSSKRMEGAQDSTVVFESRLEQLHRTNQNQDVIRGSIRKESSRTIVENTKQKNQEEGKNRSEQMRDGGSLSNRKIPVAKLNHDNPVNSDSLHLQNLVANSIGGSDRPNDTTVSTRKEKEDSMQSARPKGLNDKSKSSLSFAAGLSLHQQLPIAGQKFVPYNSRGGKGTLTDYIPSVYIRMYKRDKWFIQSGFRYAAPQYTKQFVYQQRVDSSLNGFTTYSTTLNKTYYHQLPLTFNYLFSKHLSVGAGVVWNRFASAISGWDVVRHNNLTGTDSVINKGTIFQSKISDSSNFFVRSWFQALLEAEYKWNRFSVGARCAMGLEPYIKFELQPGVPQQEKNSSIDIFIRYELWRSKKK